MRRPIRFFFCLTLAAALICSLFAACKSEPFTPEKICLSFTCDASVTLGESTVDCTFSHTAQEVGYVLINSPAQLAGVCFEWTGDAYCISYNGLRCESDEPFLSNFSFATALMNVFAAAADGDSLTSEGESSEAAVFSGNSRSGPFQITVDPKSGYVREVKVDSLKLKAECFDHR